MAQLFRASANFWFRLVALAILIFILGIAISGGVLFRSPFYTRVAVPIAQPVPFSHEHHVSGLGIDCRYCHTTVETSSFAGIPPTETCMTCHSQIWTNASVLAPVRQSYTNNQPLEWNRIHDLPDFVYFDHSIHVKKGIGCTSCHGRVEQMPITFKVETLHMRWCLECHTDPGAYVAKQTPPRDVSGLLQTASLLTNNVERLPQSPTHIGPKQLENCSVCHR